jgi:hypothetical protein
MSIELERHLTNLRVICRTILRDSNMRDTAEKAVEFFANLGKDQTPIDMVLFCPSCGRQHIDEPAVVGKLFMCHHSDPMTCSCSNSRWHNPPHRSHLCHNPDCKTVWRPADVPTNGVAAIKTAGKNDTCKVEGGA